MGYNDFTALRQSLADIEEIKLKIDKDLTILQSDVAKQNHLRDEEIPKLERLIAIQKKRMPKLTQDLTLEHQKLVSANDELLKLRSQVDTYDSSKNVKLLRLGAETKRRTELNRIKNDQYIEDYIRKKIDKWQFWTSVFLAVSFVLILIPIIMFLYSMITVSVEYSEQSDSLIPQLFPLGVGAGMLVAIFLPLYAPKVGVVVAEFVFDLFNDQFRSKFNPSWAEMVEEEYTLDMTARMEEIQTRDAEVVKESDLLHKKCTDHESFITSLQLEINKMESELEERKRVEGENVEFSRTIEQEIKDLVTQIPQQINDIRNNSTRIEQIFDGVKHLIPNSETVSPNSSNLDEILDAIAIEIN